MMGNPKPQKPGLRQIALTSDVHGSNVIVLPLPCAREEEENIGNAVQVRTRATDSQCKFPQILLIECMLEKMCAIYEHDPTKQKELYIALRRYLAKFHLLPKTKEAPEMESLKVHFAADLNRLFCLAKRDVSVKDSSIPDPQLTVAKPSPLSGTIWASVDGTEHLFTSRYELDFEEIEFIAAGGFGVVYKSRNILDNKYYAIKKIVIRPNSAAKILREVQLLSSLNHPNIVAYKSAWLEYCSPRSLHDILQRMEGSPFSSQGRSSFESTTETSQSYEAKSSHSFVSEKSHSIVFEHSSRTDTAVRHSFHSSREMLSTTSKMSSLNKIVSTVSSSSLFSNRQSYGYRDHVVTPTVLLLYLQMQLCPQTLRHWLNARNKNVVSLEDLSMELIIFRQILQGVIHIHSNNIIHRDIKPDNIFIDEKTRQVQIGDFGLAKLRVDNDSSSIMRPVNLSGKAMQGTKGVGTHSYAAPEQLASNDADWKSDMYSLGIVLLELLYPFKTDMERHRTIQDLRKLLIIPREIEEKWPHLAVLILKMISNDPVQRPSAAEVMLELVANRGAVAKKQQETESAISDQCEAVHDVSHLLLVIESLKKELAEKNLIIERLTSGSYSYENLSTS